METTAHALNTRAAKYVASLPVGDPLAEANALIDRAIALQNEGRFAEADALLAHADALIA